MASNQQTLNQLKDIFYSLAMNNKLVNEFGFGPTYNINAGKQRRYPLVWVEASQTVANKSDISQGRIQYYTYSFNIYVMDRIEKGDENFDEILSDCQLILQSFIVNMDQHPYWTDLGINISGDVIWQPVFEVEDDNLNGWMAALSLKVFNRLTPCNTPQILPLSWTTSFQNATYELRLIGPQGPAGATGATGPEGPQGPQGFNGFSGSDASNVLNYIYEATTGTPTNQNFSSDNPDTSLLTRFFINEIDEATNDRNGWFQALYTYSFGFINSAILQVSSKSDSSVLGVYYVEAIQQGSPGVWIIRVNPISTTGAIFNNSDSYSISWVLNGRNGAAGATGPEGPQGPQGFQGAQGNQGNQGSVGPQGFQGEQGPQGFQGNQGSVGLQGFQGEQGPQGFQGSVGPQGFQGNQGFQGPQGFQGNQGFQGPQGFQGAQGFQGNQGSTGATWRLTRRYETGSGYTFSLTDTDKIILASSSVATFNFTVPQFSSVGFTISDSLAIMQYGTATVSVTWSSPVIVNSVSNFRTLNSRYTSAVLMNVETNTWVLIGNLK